MYGGKGGCLVTLRLPWAASASCIICLALSAPAAELGYRSSNHVASVCVVGRQSLCSWCCLALVSRLLVLYTYYTCTIVY